jgi:hypothetical protein
MRVRASSVLIAAVLGMGAWPAAAQQQPERPAAGHFAVGVDLGFFKPRPGFDVSATVDGFGEFYLARRVSLRGLVGWANPGIDNGTACQEMPTGCGANTWQQVRLELSAIYNWEAGEWHPYVLGGVGVHALPSKTTGNYSGDFSVHAGGGVEYFARPKVVVKGEVAFHGLGRREFGRDPSGLTLTVGLKRYF